MQIESYKKGVQINGLFGWIKKNIIAPVVTFVVTVVVAVGVLVATTVVGFMIGGPVGAAVGAAVGFASSFFTRNPVRRFLDWADLYEPYADVYSYY